LLAWAQAQMPAGFSLHTLANNVGSRAFYRRHGLIEGATHESLQRPGDDRVPVGAGVNILHGWRCRDDLPMLEPSGGTGR
jgi:hypothetical protein